MTCKFCGADSHGVTYFECGTRVTTDDGIERTIRCYQREIANLKAVLREVEWVLAPDGAYECPACWNVKTEGHHNGCILGKALKGEPDAT